MVHVPTRLSDEREVPVRLGPSIQNVPDYGPSKMQPRPVHRSGAVRARARAGAQHDLAARRPVRAGQGHRRLAQLREPWRDDRHRPPARGPPRRRSTTCAATAVRRSSPSGRAAVPPSSSARTTAGRYDLTGKVKGVPERIDFDPEHLKGLRSPQVAVDEWGGWVWVNLAGPDAAPSLQSWIGEEIMLDLGQYDMDDMVLLDVLEWDVPVSYKAIVDGFNEIYHTAELHQRRQGRGRSPPATPASGSSTTTTTCASCRAISTATNSSRTGTITSGRSATTSSSPTRSSTATPSTSRCSTRSRSTSTAPASCAGRSCTPATTTTRSTQDYRRRMQDHWDHLKVVVGEDIDDLRAARAHEALERLSREHPERRGSARSRHYHETMARMIQGES